MYLNPSANTWTCSPPINPTVEEFCRRLPEYNSTRLVSLPDLARDLGLGHVFVKDESFQLGLPAPKIPGAPWAVYRSVAAKVELPQTCTPHELSISANTQGITLVTCTDGNWGRAVARMAKYLRIPATVFVPQNMDQATKERIAGEGARVSVVSGNYDEPIRAARKEADFEGSFGHDTSWSCYEEIPKWVVEGYSTMLTETDRQVQEQASKQAICVVTSVGVGSFAQSVVMHYKSRVPTATVVTVEPETAACLKTSLEVGKIMSVQYLHIHGVQASPCGAAPLSALKKSCETHASGPGPGSVVVLFSTEGSRTYSIT
ncbi:tryptophan synthase beta subunit-like PLP-dependent enzyme [Glonium stellatum]|uniref:Tryptophan synthase beta subunit-like PLP-dependent enzyme n=1 Tax=Glonium stellatum TaxID=574774 RepID=A0A8E2FDZ4_9PEZI|nr:tryptophan synthase beta subunit-like PLP-dependent enzyme [Glonium stellatum]